MRTDTESREQPGSGFLGQASQFCVNASFSLGDPDVLAKRLSDAGFKDVQVERVIAPVRLDSGLDCLQFEQESFGALHQMLGGLSEPEKDAAWAEIEEALGQFEHDGRFEGPCEMFVASATK